VSEFSAELEARLARNARLPAKEQQDDLADIRKWWLETSREHNLEWVQMSPVEIEFSTNTWNSFERGRRAQN
jgi:hypothetical protein